MRKIFVIFSLIFVFCVGTLAKTKSPNVLIFITDDQGMGDIGIYGSPIVKTPNIDEFARQSINLMDFHVGPSCSPTRSALLTGRYCNATGLWHTIMQRSLMRENEVVIAKVMKDNGYKTGAFGKWHLGDFAPYRPMDKGFDKSVVHCAGAIGNTPDFWGNDYFDDTYLEDGKPKKFEGYCTKVWADEAIKFITNSQKADKPFFCYLATNAPHAPLIVDEKYSDMYKGKTHPYRAKFFGMITNLDEHFKRVLDKLDELNIAEDTIVIFMTDNGTAGGAASAKNGRITGGYNMNMRGVKCSPYEGGHRVPCMIRYPRANLKNEKIDTLTSHIDIMPTILELCDIDYKPDLPLYGKSLVKLLKGDKTEYEGRIIITDSQRVDEPQMWKDSATMQDKWRLVNGKELYDISTDPSQENDISKLNPEKVKELKQAYVKWYGQVFDVDYLSYSPLYVGKDIKAQLDAHYWQAPSTEVAWDQIHIRKGLEFNGWWQIEVKDEGQYCFELARYPLEADKPIRWGNDEPITVNTGAKALDIKKAELFVDNKKVAEAEVDDTQKTVKFKVQLKQGKHKIKTYFKGNDELSLGAYYVYVNFCSEK